VTDLTERRRWLIGGVTEPVSDIVSAATENGPPMPTLPAGLAGRRKERGPESSASLRGVDARRGSATPRLSAALRFVIWDRSLVPS
jgi:hypothetical protein